MVVETRLDGRWSGRRGFIPGSARGLVRLTEVRPVERTQRIGQRPTLKLRPDAELATLPGAALPPSSPMVVPQPSQQCCVNCVVGSGIPRCPNPNEPSVLPQGTP